MEARSIRSKVRCLNLVTVNPHVWLMESGTESCGLTIHLGWVLGVVSIYLYPDVQPGNIDIRVATRLSCNSTNVIHMNLFLYGKLGELWKEFRWFWFCYILNDLSIADHLCKSRKMVLTLLYTTQIVIMWGGYAPLFMCQILMLFFHRRF